jgi:tetratricopeptide (TPR) repeat protein
VGSNLSFKFAVFLCAIFCFGYALAQDGNVSDKKDSPESQEMSRALEMVKAGDLGGAEKLLKGLIAKMPSSWKPVNEFPDRIEVAFWDRESFMQCSPEMAQKSGKKIEWIWPNYANVYYYLAYIEVERKNYDSALTYLELAKAIEPSHPSIYTEKGYILAGQRKLSEAYESYKKAEVSSPCMSSHVRAVILRGKGYVLIDLGRLDEAEGMFKSSLEIEPDNKIAKNELGYIEDLRKRQTVQ